MLVVEIVIAALVVFGVAAVAMGYGGSITHFAPDWPSRGLPDNRTVRGDDVAKVRFSLAFRGYRMHEVDTTLDQLALEISMRDARIEQLTGRPFESSDVSYESPSYESPSYQPPQSPEPPSSPAYELPDPQRLADNPFAPPIYRADDAPH